jgi:diadenosine tetraphosphatase ApaH/serine/threonine PP2A family protein phosphatase
MKTAILADIHSNLTALEAVLADVEKKSGIDQIWCLGDIVGYGPDPHACIELIQKYASDCTAGNHDWAAIGKIDAAHFNYAAAEAARWTSRQLSAGDIDFLQSLPLSLKKGDFTLVHGSPRDPIWEYILSSTEAEENLEYFETPYCLVGHSHLPLLFVCNQQCSTTHPEDGLKIKLGKKRLIINPGGTGQPRDSDPRASYAIYHQEVGTITFHRVKYDITGVQRRMEKAGLPAWLISRLSSGR